jgi:hypothetical protein
MAGVLPQSSIEKFWIFSEIHHPAIFWYHHGYMETSGVSPD